MVKVKCYLAFLLSTLKALANMRNDRGRRSSLLTHVSTNPIVFRPRISNDAADNYLRGRGLTPGGMNEILNHGWTE